MVDLKVAQMVDRRAVLLVVLTVQQMVVLWVVSLAVHLVE